MNLLFLPLVNWGMGAAIIAVFVIVCIVMVAIVLNLAKGDKKDNQSNT
ncbi:MAG: ABC-type spermidine/putrescine transport system permease subunit I [Flavobacteriales bacterium]|jgi:ABC-type spermidine/putrescine transport system permease subunit I